MKNLLALLALFLVAVLDVSAAQKDLEKFVPNDLVAGWSYTKDSAVYGKGESLAAIYNGGYQEYTKGGVVEALRKMYERKGRYVEITLHRMSSAKAASSFYQKQFRELNKTAPPAGQSKGFFVTSSEGSTAGHGFVGFWYYTISAFETDAVSNSEVNAFQKALALRLK